MGAGSVAAIAVRIKCLMGKPYEKSIKITVNRYTSAFPKSGCLKVKKNMGRVKSKAVMNLPKLRESSFVKNCAIKIIKNGLMISENWILTPNKSIHRTAPLASIPIKKRNKSAPIIRKYKYLEKNPNSL